MIHNADSLWVKSGKTPPVRRYLTQKDEGLPGTAELVSQPVRFFNAVDTSLASITVLHALIMVTAPHTVSGLRHHRRTQSVDHIALLPVSGFGFHFWCSVYSALIDHVFTWNVDQ